MKKGTLTRDQAINIVGIYSVDQVENESCDFTNRVGYNGTCQGDDEVEFSASVRAEDKDGNDFLFLFKNEFIFIPTLLTLTLKAGI